MQGADLRLNQVLECQAFICRQLAQLPRQCPGQGAAALLLEQLSIRQFPRRAHRGLQGKQGLLFESVQAFGSLLAERRHREEGNQRIRLLFAGVQLLLQRVFNRVAGQQR